MPLAVGTIIETVASWLSGPELAECVLHHRVKTAASGTVDEDIFAFSQAAEALFEALTEACMVPTTMLVGTQTRVLPGFAGSGMITSSFSEQVGGVSGEDAGAQECALVTKYTATTTRRGRGRMYIPFVPESFINSGKITTDARTLYEDNFRPLLSDLLEFGSGGDAYAGVYSRTAAEFYPMTFAVLRPVTVTQKRRVNHRQPFAAPPV